MDYLKSYQVRFPRGVHFGLGASEKVGGHRQDLWGEKSFIVTDRLLGPSGIIEKISQILSRGGVTAGDL